VILEHGLEGFRGEVLRRELALLDDDVFSFQDVESRSAEDSFVEGLDESLRLDQAAARGVDQQGAALDRPDVAPVEHVMGLGAIGGVQADDIAVRQQLVEPDVLESEGLGQ